MATAHTEGDSNRNSTPTSMSTSTSPSNGTQIGPSAAAHTENDARFKARQDGWKARCESSTPNRRLEWTQPERSSRRPQSIFTANGTQVQGTTAVRPTSPKTAVARDPDPIPDRPAKKQAADTQLRAGDGPPPPPQL